jgi:hypothetical protein
MNDLSFQTPEPNQNNAESLTDSFANSSSPVENSNTYESKGLSLIAILLVVVFLVLTGYGTYQLLQIKNTEKEIELTNQALVEARTASLAETERVNIDYRSRFLTQKKEDQLFWSNIITNIESSIPNTRKTNINSINGTENGNINISFNTTPQSTTPFNDTADLITAFKNKNFFENVLIPNIGSSVTSSGQSQLTYSLRLNYLKQPDETKAVNINIPQRSNDQANTELLDTATIQEIINQQEAQESNNE